MPVTGASNSDAVLALAPQTGEWSLPCAFPTRWVSSRATWEAEVDDPKAGWKGRGFWTGYNSYTPWHAEGGKGALNKVVKLQIRPDPLAK